MSVYVFDFQVITNERLQSFPLEQRVFRFRSCQQSLYNCDMQPQISVQKIKPSVALNDDELRQLKISTQVLDKYPSITDYLNSYLTLQEHFFTTNVLIPANIESAQILTELQFGQLNQQIFIISPITVQFITGMCFDKLATMTQMYDILQKNFENNVNQEVDQFNGSQTVHFADSLQPTIISYPQQEESNNNESDNQELCLQNTLKLLNVLKIHYRARFYEVLFYFTDLYLDQMTLNVIQSPLQMMRLEATAMLQLRQLEQLGIKYQDIQDIKHIYPNVTIVKFVQKVQVQDKIEQILQFYQENKIIKNQNGQSIKLLSKPLLVDKFVSGPYYLLVKDVDNSNDTVLRLKEILQIIGAARKNEPFKVYNKQKLSLLYEDGIEVVKSTVDQQQFIAIVPFTPSDPDSNRHIISQLSETTVKYFEFGFVSEQQINLLTRKRKCVKEVAAEQRQQPQYNQYVPQGQHYYNQPHQGYGGYDQYDIPKQLAASGYNQIRGSSTPGIGYQNRNPQYVYEYPTSLKEQKMKCKGVQLRDLPFDVKVKDVAGFCKSEKVADIMSWNLHSPFNVQQGPIRLMNGYILVLFVTQQAAEKAVQALNKAYFRNKPVTATLSNDPADQQFIDQCFQLKDTAQFSPAYIVIMKQINLPYDTYKFLDVVEKDWKVPRPDYARVRNDNAICFFRNKVDADIFYKTVRKDFFAQHLNDIYRMDMDD